jgi:hypothetical protein
VVLSGRCSAVLTYGSQAQALFGGAGVVSATADATSGAPGAVLVAAGGSLFRVTVSGVVTLVGVIQDSTAGYSRVVPTGLTFVGPNAQCGAAAADVAQGERGECVIMAPGPPAVGLFFSLD